MTNCLREAFRRLSSEPSSYSTENKITFIPQGGTNGRSQDIHNIEVLYRPSSKVNRISRDLAKERFGYKIDGSSATKDITLVWHYHKEYNCKYKSKFRISSERNLGVVFGPNDTFVYGGSSVINARDAKANPFGDALRDGHLKKCRSSCKKSLLKTGSTTSRQTTSRPRQGCTGAGGTSQQGLEGTAAPPLREESLVAKSPGVSTTRSRSPACNTGDGHLLPETDRGNPHMDIYSMSIPMLHFLQEPAIPARDQFPAESSWQTTATDVSDGSLMKSLDPNRHIQTNRQADENPQRSGPSDDSQATLRALRGKALEHPDQYWHWDEMVQKYYHFDDDSEFPIWYELLD